MSDSEKKQPDATQAQAPTQKPKLPARFYKSVSVESSSHSHRILLDGRPMKTPARKSLQVPTQKLAQDLKTEWEAQETHIDPETMPMTKLVNTALDGIEDAHQETIDAIAAYVTSDALCYRAPNPSDLLALQERAWDPILVWAKDELGLALNTTCDLMPAKQPEETLQTAKAILSQCIALELGALHVLTTLTGSFVLAQGIKSGHLTPDEAWKAAHIDEDYQIKHWGQDAEAAARRTFRHRQFATAHRLLTQLA